MTKIIETNIESLVPDNKNFNKGTEYGDRLMDESLRKFGLARSIVIDKNNRIIAGNKTAEKAADIGFTDVLVVEVDGNQLVAVKRKDIDLADNATSKANLAWDESLIEDVSQQWGFEPQEWGVDVSVQEEPEQEESSGKKEISTRLIVECGDVTKLSLLFSELQDRGFSVELKE